MSVTVNLGLKYLKQIQQRFTIASILQARLSNDLDFVGVRSVRIHTIGTVPINAYDRFASANRYGIPQEVGDSLQELSMTQDKSFTGIIDKGNSLDQAINKAGKFLRVQLDEAMIPFKDGYGFWKLCMRAGRVVGDSAPIAENNVIDRLAAARTWLLNHRVPVKGRTLYVSAEMYNAMIKTPQFVYLEKLGNKAIINGQVGELMGSPVVEVPEDLLPNGVNFIWVHQRAASSPAKISDTKVHVDPPGISGNLVEGRFYWDTFVFGAKADGIYVDVTTDTGPEQIVVLPNVVIADTDGAISNYTSGADVLSTLDGTDPRYSTSAKMYSAPPEPDPGTVMKAAQRDDAGEGMFPSGVTETIITG
jgi:hypothetical protein